MGCGYNVGTLIIYCLLKKIIGMYFISGNINSTFRIHHDLGNVQLLKSLQGLKDSKLHLIIRAQDQGFPALFSDIRVQINIVPSEKKPPE